VSTLYLTQALKLPLGTAAKPGAGFSPMAVGVFACVVPLPAGASPVRRPRVVRLAEPSEPIDPARRQPVGAAGRPGRSAAALRP